VGDLVLSIAPLLHCSIVIMEKTFLHLRDIDAYRISFQLSNDIWKIVVSWDWFARETVGRQYVRAIDSISANIAEGFGRYNKKDKMHFYRYAQGSLKESLDWHEKSWRRKLISEKNYQMIFASLRKLPKELNSLIKFTQERLVK
jgi:four helix bundle protein